MAKLDELVVELKAIDKGLQAAIRSAGGEIDRLDNRTKKFTSSLGAEVRNLRRTFITLAAAWGAFYAGKAIIDAGMQMEALRFRMQAATGNANVAAVAMDYVRAEAERLGLDLNTTATGFASFSASALRAGLTFEETKQIFTGVSEAATAMRLSGERVQLVFMALSQMASKGRVSMEELRQQLGESMPGAIQLFAKAMGVGNAEFIKMVENGQVTTRDLIKLGNGLRNEFAGAAMEASNSAQASFNRLGNSWLEMKAKMAESGFLDAIARSADNLSEKMSDPAMQQGMTNFGYMLGGIAEAATDAAGMLANFLMKVGEVEVKAFRLLKQGSLMSMRGYQGGQARMPSIRGPMNTGPSGAKSDKIDQMFQDMYAGHTLSPSGNEPVVDEKLRERLDKRVEALRYSLASETEQAAMEWKRQGDLLNEALEADAITRQEYRELNLKNEMEYQERLEEIRQGAREKELTNEQAFTEGFLGIERLRRERTASEDAASFRQSISQAAQHNAVFFQLEKAAALARAALSARESVVSAYAFGSRLGGPVLGAAFAGIAAAAQAANMAAIASTSFGGGSSNVSSSGGGLVAGGEASPLASSGGGSGQIVHVTLYGDDNKTYTKGQIRDLMEQFNDAGRDGSRFNVVLA